mgnify:CR=1 FL=1
MKIRNIEFKLHEDEALSNHIRREQDFFEPDILDYLKDHHPTQNLIIDAGANIGNHSIYFANFLKYKEIYCFEPLEVNFRVLKSNLPYPNIQLFQKALSDKGKTLKMSANTGNMGASKIDLNGDTEVEAITLDSLNLENVSLLKIDVENHEPQVLIGAQETIQRCKPLILIEDWNETYAKLLPNYILEKAWRQGRLRRGDLVVELLEGEPFWQLVDTGG